jgi:hypothetical protein
MYERVIYTVFVTRSQRPWILGLPQKNMMVHKFVMVNSYNGMAHGYNAIQVAWLKYFVGIVANHEVKCLRFPFDLSQSTVANRLSSRIQAY